MDTSRRVSQSFVEARKNVREDGPSVVPQSVVLATSARRTFCFRSKTSANIYHSCKHQEMKNKF